MIQSGQLIYHMILVFQNIKKKALIFSAFFLLYALIVQGQKDTMVVLDSFVVTASRLPQPANTQNTYITSPIAAALAQGTSINDYIQAAPGIFTLSNNNYAQDSRITSRGFGARSSFGIRGIKIWVDDIPETTPDGQSQLDNLDYQLIHSTEILRGPDAALYGNVSGAMIKIYPTPFDSLKEGVKVRLAGGSFGFRQAGIQLVPKTDNWKWQFGYAYQGADGYRKWSAFSNHIGNIRGRFQKAGHELKILINGVFNPQSQDPGALNYIEAETNPREARSNNIQYKAGENLHQQRMALIYKKSGAKTYQQLKAYYLNRRFSNFLAFSTSGWGEIKRKNHGLYYEVGNLLKKGKFSWIAGADWQYQQDFRSNYDNLQGEKGTLRLAQNEVYKDLSVYSLNSFQLTPRFRGEVNVRLSAIQTAMEDHFQTDGDQSGIRNIQSFNPSLKLSYQLNRQMSVNFINSTGFESPTLTELSVSPDGKPGFNPALNSSKTRLFEVHFHYGTTTDQSIDIHWFHVSGSNEIIPFEIPSAPGRFYYENSGTSNRKGLELAVKWPLSDKYQLGWNYTYNYAFLLNGSDPIPGIPVYVHQIQLMAQPVRKLQLRIDHQLVGKIYLLTNSSSSSTSYIEANIQAGYTLDLAKQALVFNIGLNNLYNAKYYSNIRINATANRFYEPAPPTHFWAGIQLLW